MPNDQAPGGRVVRLPAPPPFKEVTLLQDAPTWRPDIHSGLERLSDTHSDALPIAAVDQRARRVRSATPRRTMVQRK